MADFALKMEGARDGNLKEWEHTRILAYTIAKPYLKNRKLSIENFWPLHSDKKKKGDTTKADEVKKKAKETLARVETMNWTKSKK